MKPKSPIMPRPETSYEWIKNNFLPAANYYAKNASAGDVAFLKKRASPEEWETLQEGVKDEADLAYWQMFSDSFLKIQKSNEKILIVQPDLLDLFRVTDFKSIPAECMAVPYESVFISGDFLKIEMRGEVFSVDGLIVYRPRNEKSVTLMVGLVAWYPLPSGLKHYEIIGNYGFRMDNNENILEAPLHLTNLTPLVEGSDAQNQIVQKYKGVVFGLLANIFLYVNSTHSDARQEAWKEIDPRIASLEKKARAKRISELKQNYVLATILGETIKLDGQTKTHIEECRRTNKPLSVRFMVRGHWRNQHFGSKEKETSRRSLIWIQPFWKGSADRPYSNKPYELVNTPKPSKSEELGI